MIIVEQQNKIAVISLYRPPANAMNIEFCTRLENAIKTEIVSDSKGIILTGYGSIFSAGVDLVELLEGGRDYIVKFLVKLEQLVETLVFCPKPIVSAINGHAIAGGCVIASCCDYRLMAQGKARIGVPELRVGVPFPVIIMELMRAKVNNSAFDDVVLGGRTYTVDSALQKGLIDEIVSLEELLDKAMLCAQSYADIRPEVFSFSKVQARQPIREATIARNKLFRDEINAIWESEETMLAIRNYMEKTFKK